VTIDILEVKTIFWDFDGVIKDSVEVKSGAFEYLFLPFGKEIAKKVRMHHEANGGMSRFEKIPIYLEWSGQVPLQHLIDEYAAKFSLLVRKKVIASEWIDGVFGYLENNYNRQHFFLITATPQKEIEDIILSLNIKHFFKEVIGAPTKKNDAINILLKEYSIVPESSLMVGDSSSDYYAAKKNGVPFVLKRSNLNKALQRQLDCMMIYDFL